MLDWFKPFSGIVEQMSHKYLPASWYQALGHYLWPEMLVKNTPAFCSSLGFETLEEGCRWVIELDPKVAFAATAGVAIIAGGIYYWLTHRHGKVEARPLTVQTAKEITCDIGEISEKKGKKASPHAEVLLHVNESFDVSTQLTPPQKIEQSSDEPIKALAAIITNSPVIKTNESTNEEEGVTDMKPQLILTAPRMMPVDTICRTYLNKYRSNDASANFYRIHYSSQTYQAQQFVLKKMRLHLDGTVPTDPSEIAHYNHELDKLGLITHKL